MVNISAIFCILAQWNMSRATFLNGNLVIKGMKNALLPLFSSLVTKGGSQGSSKRRCVQGQKTLEISQRSS